MNIPDSPWKGDIRFARVFVHVPPNDDKELHSRDICKEGSAYKWRYMKRFLFPPSLLMVKLLERNTVKTYESLSLCDVFQQHLRACQSLTDNHEQMKYKRSVTDGRSDWVRFVEGMCSSDSTYIQFHQDPACLPGPLLPRRTGMRLEQQLALECLPKKDCNHSCHGSTIAPIHSSMWFDAEHIKGILNDAIVFQEIRTIDGIIEERLGISNSVQHPFLQAPTARRSSTQDWYVVFQMGCIMRQMSWRNRVVPGIFKLLPGFSTADSQRSSTLLTTMSFSQFTERNQDPKRDVNALWRTCRVEPVRRAIRDGQDLSRRSCTGNDVLVSFEAQDCGNSKIEVPVLRQFQGETDSMSVLRDTILSQTQAKWRLCSAPGNISATNDIKDFCSQDHVNNRRWHQGPKDIMTRCSPLQDPRRFGLISQFEVKFQKVSFSPSAEDIVEKSLNETLIHAGLRRQSVAGDKHFEHLYQLSQVEARKNHSFKLKFLDVVELQYDPPQKRSSPPIELMIHPRGYTPPIQGLLNALVPRNGEARDSEAQKIDKPSDDEANVSNFGLLDTDIEGDGLMDIPVELTAADSSCHLQSFETFAQTCIVSKSQDYSPSRLPPGKLLKPRLLSREQDVRKNLAEENSLKVPERLICRPWMLELAQACIQEDHAAIYMPSPLSCMPSLSIVAHTLLSKIDEDFRVLILCLGNPNIPLSVKNYFSYIFGDDYLVAVYDQTLSNEEDGDQEGQKKLEISRILITNAADAPTGQSFPLLFVLLDSAAEVGDNHLGKSIKLLSKSSPWTENKQMIFIAPYRSLVSCADFHVHAQALMKSMHVAKAILCNSGNEEIRACLTLSRLENLLLVPSRTASNVIRIIDKKAKQIMTTTPKIDTSRPNLRGSAERNLLKSMTLSFLEDRIDGTLKSKDVQRQRVWMELHTLRHARSYALYDGVSAAVSFLTNALSRFRGETSQELLGALRDLKAEADHEQKSEKKNHPVVKAIRKLLISEEQKMKEAERAVSRLWMCQTFSPLVITESDVMMSGIMNGVDNMMEHDTAERGETAVCLLESLRSERVFAESQLPFLNRYSHVFYVSMDRTGQDALGRLPSWILSVWYAGGLRLVNISVDETRCAADAIEAGESWFESLRQRVVQETGNRGAKQGFITTQLPCPPLEVADVDAVMTTPSTYIERIDDFSTSPAPELRFPESYILAFATDDDLRKAIWEQLNNRQSSIGESKVILRAQISVSRGNTAVTRIACAIAMDEKLRRIVSVRFTFC